MLQNGNGFDYMQYFFLSCLMAQNFWKMNQLQLGKMDGLRMSSFEDIEKEKEEKLVIEEESFKR